ncbi:Aspartate aminotransferase, cytoplasmic [Tulasnella sp. 417]|nr:Aspartate aminotransferase, cytoplasmic [Tulasnella sp. 417]
MASRVKQILAHVSGSNDEPPRTKMSEPSIQVWQSVPLAPPDSIFKLTAAYKTDTDPRKVNLGVGAYRDDNNKPWILPSIKEANKRLLSDESLDHEYLPILGLPEYTAAAAKLMLSGDSPAIREGRAVSAQTISGTGANHLGALFLSKFYQWNGPPTVYLSNPTWANHHQIFKNVGIQPVEYAYYDPKTIGLDFVGMKEAISSAVPRSVFLLHACAHNPTGVDPTPEQWAELADLFIEKGHYAFFDCAYQGFASGDLAKDGEASFAKNAGLYGERVGALHVLAATKDEADRVRSQLSILQRSEISNPPAYGARLIALLLNDEQLLEQWKEDIKTMAYRIIDMRKQLHHILTNELQTPGNWDHIVSQIGMFSFTGITPAQANAIIEKAHVYMTGNGRISMAGLNSKNIRYFAESLDKAVRGTL